MGKCICNEQNGLWYELQGDCHLPCLMLPEEPEVQHWHLGGSGTDTIAKATPGRCVPLCTPATDFLCVVLVMLHYSHSVIGGIKFSIALRSFG